MSDIGQVKSAQGRATDDLGQCTEAALMHRSWKRTRQEQEKVRLSVRLGAAVAGSGLILWLTATILSGGSQAVAQDNAPRPLFTPPPLPVQAETNDLDSDPRAIEWPQSPDVAEIVRLPEVVEVSPPAGREPVESQRDVGDVATVVERLPPAAEVPDPAAAEPPIDDAATGGEDSDSTVDQRVEFDLMPETAEPEIDVDTAEEIDRLPVVDESPAESPAGELLRLPKPPVESIEGDAMNVAGSPADTSSEIGGGDFQPTAVPEDEPPVLKSTIPEHAADNWSMALLPRGHSFYESRMASDQALTHHPFDAGRSMPELAPAGHPSAVEPPDDRIPMDHTFEVDESPDERVPMGQSFEIDESPSRRVPLGQSFSAAQAGSDGAGDGGSWQPAPIPVDAPSHERAEQAEAAMLAVDQVVHAKISQGLSLAGRGAYYAARAQFVQALRAVAQALDTRDGVSEHSQALAEAIRAMAEADDFVPRGSRLEGDLNIARLVATHRTPALKDEDDLRHVTPVAALQSYLTFAQRRLADASAGVPAGSSALYGLGKILAVLGDNDQQRDINRPKAMAMHQAALLVDGSNYLSANELGVLLAKYGQLDDARRVLVHSISIVPQPEAWHNLAIVHERLGQSQLAEQARFERQLMDQQPSANTAEGPRPVPAVRWVTGAEFTASKPGVTP